MSHTFHIPVLGLAYSVDTPLKVARYGISSVVSIVDDQLLERIRQFYSFKNGHIFNPIDKKEPDSRAKRITAFLNLMQELVDRQFETLRNQPFAESTDISRYFSLLPESSSLKQTYNRMLITEDEAGKKKLQAELRKNMKAGEIHANIMSKVDKINFKPNTEMPTEHFSDALSALRGFAQSRVHSSLVLSAGMNPRLYSYVENFSDFFPDENGYLKKKIILKVSDFRSAFIQARFLAKKGIWVSEFRIESGLNCGGHAFATEGYLLGPILEEFKIRKKEMRQELHEIYAKALQEKGISVTAPLPTRFSVQGGIGTHQEDQFLRSYYDLDSTGWGSPFLLVPEATNVDTETLQNLITATADDFYISGSSPLGVPFNNFRKSTAEKLRLERIARGRPGSPCTKKYLISNTEFTDKPICTASREYQHLKIKQLLESKLSEQEYQEKFNEITEKVCLCEGLATPAYLKNGLLKPKENKAVVICPGPNLAYFSGSFSLDEMVRHIYGKVNLLEGVNRPDIFINELNLYLEHLKKDMAQNLKSLTDKKEKYFTKFREQLQNGINYYKKLIPEISHQTEDYLHKMRIQLSEMETRLQSFSKPGIFG